MPDKKSEHRGPGQGPGSTRQGGKPSREIERENLSEVESDELLDRDFDLDADEDLDEEGEITQRNPRVGVDHEQDNLDPDRDHE